MNDGIEDAWADEIRRRIASIDSGEVELISWDKYVQEMQARRERGNE